MNKPFHILTVGDEEYKLCFPSAVIISLEEKFQRGVLNVLADENEMAKVGTQVTLLHAALQKYQHGTKMDDARELYDNILISGEGNGLNNVINAIVGALKASGFIPPSVATEAKPEVDTPKKAKKKAG